MDHSPAVCHNLLTSLNQVLDHHRSLCVFCYDSNDKSEQSKLEHQTARPPSALSDCSFYTAHTSDSTPSLSSASKGALNFSWPSFGRMEPRNPATKGFSDPWSSTSTVSAGVPETERKQGPLLKRKTSPTEVSLRELCVHQSQQSLLRAKQSEEQLRRAYELQIRAYLDGKFADLNSIAEGG